MKSSGRQQSPVKSAKLLIPLHFFLQHEADSVAFRFTCSVKPGDARTMSLLLQLKDYRLTTAEILYHLPDHPNLLQSYIWQDLDIAPRYPVLHKFLDFWVREIEGTLHSVRIASAKLVKPATVGHVDATLHLH